MNIRPFITRSIPTCQNGSAIWDNLAANRAYLGNVNQTALIRVIYISYDVMLEFRP